MQEIVKNTVQQIEKEFKIDNLYKLEKNKNIFCSHINSVVNIGLAELGHIETVKKNLKKLTKSKLYSKSDGLFYREINDNSEILNSNLNTCKNSLVALALIAGKENLLAKRIVESLYKSSLFDKNLGLFYMEVNLKNNSVNSSIITHSNLLFAIALLKLQRIEEANQIICKLEQLSFDKNNNLFASTDCKPEFKKNEMDFFSDDQALAIIAYNLIGEKRKAENLLNQTLNSPLYDKKTGLFNRNFNRQKINKTKTSYKNGLMGIALGAMGYKEELTKLQKSIIELLYNKQESLFNFSDSDTTKIPDNSILALLAINFYNLRHIIF